MKTKICDMLGIEHPIFCAAMGGAALADLCAAVSEAGAMGAISSAGFGVSGVTTEIAEVKRLTKRPFAVGLLLPLLADGVFEVVEAARPAAIIFFWGDASPFIPRCRAAGIKVIWQVGSVDEAVKAKNAGADAIIAQGFEAGGHVRGTIPTFPLIPAVRAAIGDDLPLIAAGGIADGRGLVAAIALGADAAMFGTRFIASAETAAHQVYRDRVVHARSGETVYTELFNVGWPAPHRVLINETIAIWERAGRPPTGNRPGEGDTIGHSMRGDHEIPLVRYGVHNPSGFIEGDVEGMALYAGESAAIVNEVMAAGEIVKRIVAEARDTIDKRLVKLTL